MVGPMRSLMMGAILVGGAFVLSACGSDGDSEPETVTVTVPAATTAAPAEPVESPQQAAPGPARPAFDQCVAIEPAPDGRYQVFDAGSAEVTFADGRLTLVSVTPAEGWTYEVDDQEPDEVEIEFRRGGEELDLELEIDDGRLEVDICNDDD